MTRNRSNGALTRHAAFDMPSKKSTKRKASSASVSSCTSSSEPIYAIKCSRTSELLHTDEENFDDCYDDDDRDSIERQIAAAATQADGTWFYDMALSGDGKLAMFRSLEEASWTARNVWEDLQKDHPFICRLAGNEDEELDAAADLEDDPDVDESGSGADPDEFKTMEGGLERWERKERFIFNPFDSELRNIASSTAVVEVVEALVM